MVSNKTYTKEQVDLAVMAGDILTVKETVSDIKRKLDAEYVTKDELKVFQVQFEIIQKIVYGVVGIILTGVIGGILTLVMR